MLVCEIDAKIKYDLLLFVGLGREDGVIDKADIIVKAYLLYIYYHCYCKLLLLFCF